MWIVGIVDDHGSPQSVAVLRTEMRVVPEGTSMIPNAKLVSERVSRRNRTLADALSPISGGCTVLE